MLKRECTHFAVGKNLIRYYENSLHRKNSQALEQAAWKGCVICILGDTQNSTGQALRERIYLLS